MRGNWPGGDEGSKRGDGKQVSGSKGRKVRGEGNRRKLKERWGREGKDKASEGKDMVSEGNNKGS